MISAHGHLQPIRRLTLSVLAVIVTLSAHPPHAQTLPEDRVEDSASSVDPGERPTWSARGVVSAFLSSRIDYVGALRIEGNIPSKAGTWRLEFENIVPVRSASGSGTIIVDGLDYRAEVSLERALGSLTWAPLIAARGSEEVDEAGSLGVVLAGLKLGRRAPQGRFDWELEAAGILGEWGLEARAAFKAGGEWRALRRTGWDTGLQAEVDSLWLDTPEDELETDLTIGPFLRLHRPGGMRLSFHVLYYRGENPLGLEDSGILAGVEFEDGPKMGRAARLPRLQAALALGGGQDEIRGRQLLDITSMSFTLFGRAWRARLLADNTLVDTELNDIYYVVVGGIERAEGRVLPGLSFYHRSGHLLGQLNDRRLSINILEAGFRTPGWEADLPGWPDTEAPSRLTGEIWLGGVVSSEFGERESWSARAAALWVLPGRWRRAAPFVGARAQQGEVENWAVQGGWVTRRELSLSVLAERDSQRLQRRDTSLALLVAQRF